MKERYVLWGAAFVICVILAATWLALPIEPGTDQGGIVEISSAAAPPVSVAKPIEIPARTERVAIVATQKQVDAADHQSWLVAREKRDNAWAERSEVAIGKMMQRIAYVGGRRRLDIKCSATICEVVGIADPDPATNSYTPVWEALERDTASDELNGVGLRRTAAIFDTGRVPEEFKIQYRRIDPAPAPALAGAH